MVSKDQTIGALICAACVVVVIGYIVFIFYPPATQALGNVLWGGVDNYVVRLWLVAIPVVVAFVVVLAIGAWIGWTMATTPPPRPIEEIEADMVEEEAETNQ
jgi:hypothetical protein